METNVKICYACKRKILEKKEKYVHLEDWEHKKMKLETWWHLSCFKKSMNRELNQLEKQAALMLAKAGNIFNNLPPELIKPRDEEYVL